MTTFTQTFASCTSCVEFAQSAHFCTLVQVVSHLISSSPEFFHIHPWPSSWRTPFDSLLSFYFYLFFFVFFFPLLALRVALHPELDNPIVMESLCYSVTKESEDAYDISTSFTDQVSNLSSAEETVLFLVLMFLQTDISFEVKFMDGVAQCWSNSRIEYFKMWHLNTSCWWIHRINHLHFFDPLHSFCRKIRTSTYLRLESYLPTSKRCWCREFVKMKIRNLQSLLVCPHNSLKSLLHWRWPNFWAENTDWHFWSWSRVRFSLWMKPLLDQRIPWIQFLRIKCSRWRIWIY